jgi:hypothetical protein
LTAENRTEMKKQTELFYDVLQEADAETIHMWTSKRLNDQDLDKQRINIRIKDMNFMCFV